MKSSQRKGVLLPALTPVLIAFVRQLEMRNFKKPTTHDAHKNSEEEKKRAEWREAALGKNLSK